MEMNFSNTVEALFKGMDHFLTTKTVVGEAIRFEDGTIILPLVDVSFGVAAGAVAEGGKKNNGGGGLGGKMTPSSVLVIQDGMTRLVQVKNQDAIAKLLDFVPELVNRFTKSKGKSEKTDEEILNHVAKEQNKTE